MRVYRIGSRQSSIMGSPQVIRYSSIPILSYSIQFHFPHECWLALHIICKTRDVSVFTPSGTKKLRISSRKRMLLLNLVLDDKNWLPFFPIIHHDIANEIPVHAQKLQYLAFVVH
uniref:Secretory carrier-associated membrane protein n=1 Tax=Brassica campestris TaxID=3711 RepID=M4DFA6_BRACM